MKRILIGCLAVFALLFVGGGVVAYVFLWRPAQQVVQTVREFQRVGDLNEQVRNGEAYRPPTDDVMSAEQLRRYVEVQRGMRAALEQDYGDLRARVEAIDAAQTPGPRELLNAYRDVASLVLEAKRAQVDALNEQRFSLAEYDWVRSQTVAALGYAGYASFDLQELVSAVQQGEDPVQPARVDVAPANAELVEPYRDELQELIGFALVGL
jgi:hypothetical protein